MQLRIIQMLKEPLSYWFVLLVISFGSYRFLRNDINIPKSGTLPGYSYPLGPKLTGISDSRLKYVKGEDPVQYISKINTAIFQATWHCNPKNSISNTKLFALISKIYPDFDVSIRSKGVMVLDYGFYYCGFCHQNSEVLTQVLIRNGFDSDTIGINGHVITRVMIFDKFYYLDPDFGVGPFVRVKGESFNNLKIYNQYLDAGANPEFAERILQMYKNFNLHRSFRGKSFDKWNQVFIIPQKKGFLLARVLRGFPKACIVFFLMLIICRLIKIFNSQKNGQDL